MRKEALFVLLTYCAPLTGLVCLSPRSGAS